MATSTSIFYGFMLFLTVFLLTWSERSISFFDLLFEATAALGTGGIDSPTTALLSPVGKIIIIGAMLVGRVGVITFGMALLKHHSTDEAEEAPEREDLAV